MLNTNDSPCKGCPERNEECHGRCETYKQWSAENAANREAIRQKKWINNTLRSYSIELVAKIRRAKQ